MEAVQVRPPDPPSTPASGKVAAADLPARDFVVVYQTHYPRLIRALRLAGADAPTAEDVAQEAFARALARWPSVQRGANPPGYVYTAGFRLLSRALRKVRRTSAATPETPLAGEPSDPTQSEATNNVAIEAALASMPPRRRACAVMCLVVGLPVHEAGEALGIADGTVRKHLDEARRDLSAALAPA